MLSKLQRFTSMVRHTIIQHPLEILWVTYVTLLLMLNIDYYPNFKKLENLIALAPLCFILLYLMRNSKIYWLLTPIPAAIAIFQHQITIDLLNDARYGAVAFCVFLCLISQYWHKDNRQFIDEMSKKAINIVFAGALAIIIWGVLSCITLAIIALFDLDMYQSPIFERFGIFAGFWAFPVLFLTLEQKNATTDGYLNHIGEMLLNWILSPSLIIYTGIIYAYVVYIIIRGEMPNGVVANVAFPYLTIGLAIQAVQLLLKNAKWQYFYRYFAYLALLPLALVWYAIYIRLSYYGLTEARIYLVIGAITLTICYGLLLTKRFAQYRLFSAISIVIILVSVFILDPQKIALEDQTQRLDHYLTEHQLLDSAGKIDKESVLKYKESLGDNRDEIDRFDSMLSYVARELRTEKLKEKYGIETAYELISNTTVHNDLRIFEANSEPLIRLNKVDMEKAKEFIVLEKGFYRSSVIYTRRSETDHNQCHTLIYQGYDFSNSESNADSYTETTQACDEIATPQEFIIAFKGIEPTIQFNVDNEVRKVFAKHHLDITQLQQNQVLEKIKDDLLKLDLGNAVLALGHISLRFEENIGYVVESFRTKYLMLR